MIVKNCWDTTHSGPLVNDYLKKNKEQNKVEYDGLNH